MGGDGRQDDSCRMSRDNWINDYDYQLRNGSQSVLIQYVVKQRRNNQHKQKLATWAWSPHPEQKEEVTVLPKTTTVSRSVEARFSLHFYKSI